MNHPFLNKDFNIHWTALTPENIETDISKALETARKDLQALEGITHPNFKNTFLVFEDILENFQRPWGLVHHLDMVCNNEALRQAYHVMLPKVTAFLTEIYLNTNLYRVLKTASQHPNIQKLSDVQKRFVNETLKDFEENGANLPEDKKKRFLEIESELASLTHKYSENVLDATNSWELVIKDKSQLSGLPSSALELAKESAKQKNIGTDEAPAFRFTLHAPSYVPAITYLDNDALRKEIWQAKQAVGKESPYDNTDLIWQILKLRNEKSELLGFSHFADSVIARRMAKTGQKALHFIHEIHKKVKTIADKEAQFIREFKAKETHQPIDLLEPWEAAYWAEKRRKKLFDFDEEELKPYFPIDSVINGMFKIVERLFGIRIEEKPTSSQSSSNNKIEVWHEDVKFYEVHDANNGTYLGSFYADWHPRESKRGGAWMNYFITGGHIDGKHVPHLGVICGNLTPPIGNEPALLTHEDVQTIFHEFGHLLHHLLSDVEIRSLAGIHHVAWDFIELPSQILENWCWEREALDLFARHYKTGEKIPEALFLKLLAARTYLQGMFTLRQLCFAKMDLELHINYKQYVGQDLDAVLEKILKDYQITYKTLPPTLIRSFTHIFSSSVGYAAGYYSYKWAEVLDADAFTKFKEEGILNPLVGQAFREKILSKGNSIEPDILFRNFMGRDPNIDALLIRSGLISK